jgi:acetoin utilization protein AcuB
MGWRVRKEEVMLVSEIMTTNVVTIPSTTPLSEAQRIMDAHRIHHLPVVDKGRPVGIVSRDSLDKAGPSKLTTFSIHEISYLLSKLTVGEMMRKDIVTVAPDATVEEAVGLARQKRVTSLLVVEKNQLVGIATANDFFDKIANPILGIDKPGIRLSVHGAGHSASDIQKIMAVIAKHGTEIITLGSMMHPDSKVPDLIIHLNAPTSGTIMSELREAGFDVNERAR